MKLKIVRAEIGKKFELFMKEPLPAGALMFVAYPRAWLERIMVTAESIQILDSTWFMATQCMDRVPIYTSEQGPVAILSERGLVISLEAFDRMLPKKRKTAKLEVTA